MSKPPEIFNETQQLSQDCMDALAPIVKEYIDKNRDNKSNNAIVMDVAYAIGLTMMSNLLGQITNMNINSLQRLIEVYVDLLEKSDDKNYKKISRM